MELADDRLAGDLVWEMFPVPAQAATPARRWRFGLECAILIVLTWLLYPPLSVALTCLTIAARDFRNGWRLARTIPDKAGGGICSLFGYAWGACLNQQAGGCGPAWKVWGEGDNCGEVELASQNTVNGRLNSPGRRG
jgi:hypothetical protein